MNRRSLLQILAVSPLAFLFRSGRADAAVHDYWLKGDVWEFPKRTLHIFRSENDFVIAYDESDAAEVFRETTGCTGHCTFRAENDGCCYGSLPEHWTQYRDDRPFTRIDTENVPHVLPTMSEEDTRLGLKEHVLTWHYDQSWSYKRTALPAWWCAREGRGFFASGNA